MPPVRSHRYLSGSQIPAFIVYPNRRRVMVWLVLGAVSSFLCFLFFLFLLILMMVTPSVFHDGAAIALAIFLGGMAALGIWATWTIASFLSSGEPTLIITGEGIWIGKIYGSFEILLSWEEIEAIYLFVGGIEKQMFIRPTNLALFLSHFGPLTRFFLRLNSLNGAPITIAQSFLDKPIAEILDQLDDLYAREVDYYHIRLWRSHVS